MVRKKTNSMDNDYKELDFIGYGMDKDDALDHYLPYRLIEIAKLKKMDIAVVQIGADDPQDLLSSDVIEFAKDKAEFKLKSSSKLINESDVIVNGQNELPFKLFTFRKC